MSLTKEELAEYPHPKAKVFPREYDIPDALVAGDIVFNKRKGETTTGFVLQLLTPKAYAAFPEAPTEGPTKGLLWFPDDESGNVCALEQREGLWFLGVI
jgi:hypothetical protein